MWRKTPLSSFSWNLPQTTLYRSYQSFKSNSATKSSRNKPSPPLGKKNSTSNQSPNISWYPGHIAKAEKELINYIKLVDVVIEVRDARILSSTTHPLISKWIQNRPIIVAISRIDQATKRSLIDWRNHYKLYPPYPSSKVFFLDGNRGDGMDRIRKQILRAGVSINEKRKKLGMEPRPVRAVVIGYPNVGKSSLINRILNRKLAPVQNVAGFTRSIKWVRVSDKNIQSRQNVIELLDSPGIIPARIHDQQTALFLAICNDIGESAYDKQRAAVALCDCVISLNKLRKGYVSIPSISARYNLSFDGDLTGEEIVSLLAERSFHSQELPASEKILADFRKGYWGLCTLECPPNVHLIDLELKKKKLPQQEGGEGEFPTPRHRAEEDEEEDESEALEEKGSSGGGATGSP
jgi:ribosome biogenesis GTPase A